MTKEQIERIRELAKVHNFGGLPIPELCDLALLGAIVQEMWGTEYSQPSADVMWNARKAFMLAKDTYVKAEHKRKRGDFDQRYPGII